jgi:hypothetical protein
MDGTGRSFWLASVSILAVSNIVDKSLAVNYILTAYDNISTIIQV